MAGQRLMMPAQIIRERRHYPFVIEALIAIVRTKPLGTFGGVLVLACGLCAAFAPWIAPYNYDTAVADVMLSPRPGYWLGTDYGGRDLLSRVIYGSRVSITVGFGAVALASFLACILGVITGYYGGMLDALLQRVVDAFMSFPWLIIMMSIMAILGLTLTNLILGLGVLMTWANSRVVRSAVLSIKESQYIEAARAIGAGDLRIILQHILPNVFAPVIVIATVLLGSAILTEASLSWLGLGVPPPNPTWGGMLSGPAMVHMHRAPWMVIFPGLALSTAVFGFNMLGDALRDVMDPRLRGTR